MSCRVFVLNLRTCAGTKYRTPTYSNKKRESWSRLDFVFENWCVLHNLQYNDVRFSYYPENLSLSLLAPMTMETRCSKVFFPNYSKKKPAEDTLVPPLWATRGKKVCFARIICSRCCTRRNLRFHVENCQHADQKLLTRR